MAGCDSFLFCYVGNQETGPQRRSRTFVHSDNTDRTLPTTGLLAHREGSTLSKRERECLTMAARGLTGEDIAIKLSISLRTVQHHFDSIRSKLGAATRQEAVYRATRSGEIAL